jgi:hypothetical protein
MSPRRQRQGAQRHSRGWDEVDYSSVATSRIESVVRVRRGGLSPSSPCPDRQDEVRMGVKFSLSLTERSAVGTQGSIRCCHPSTYRLLCQSCVGQKGMGGTDMKHGMLIAIMLLSFVTCADVARGQSLESDRPRHTSPPGASDRTVSPESSRQEGLRHGERHDTPESYVPPRSPDLGALTAPLAPSIGPGSGLLGPDAGRSPSRLRSTTETERGGTGSGRGGR